MTHEIQFELQVYCDSDWAGDCTDRKLMTGYILIMNGTAISWKSTKQSTIALSTVEAEYIALAMMTKEVLWMCTILSELGYTLPDATIINVNNDGTINVANNSIISHQTKHIDIQHHSLKDNIKANIIKL